MDYPHDNGMSPPPLDDVSSAADTDGDFEEFDLEVNAVNSCTATSIAPKQYKSFQPSIRLQPTDLVYREEHSRAAPRKGIEPKAFLAIGETRQEHVEYVGRQKQPVTAPSRQHRHAVSAANNRKHQQRQSSVHSAPTFNRTKSRPSRTASGKGRQSGWSSAGYTPLPVAPPPSMPTKENAYIHHPFKQDQSYDYHRLETSTFEEHRLSTMDEFVASLAYQSVPSRCSTSAESKRPVSPGEEMKNSTILATMEVGKYINQREKTPKTNTYREPKLLKARLRPLHTVNVDGPAITDCQGMLADRRKFGPSPMKAKQQKQLDDVIKKNAAIKDISSTNYGSRGGSSKTKEEVKRTSSAASKGKLRTPVSTSSNKREPTPSPYSSSLFYVTQLDKAGALVISSKDGIQARPSRAQSATHSEASHTEQQTIARSVSAVTIRQRESATPHSQPSNTAVDAPRTQKVDADGRKGTVFMTDVDSKPSSRATSARETNIPQRKPPAAPRQQQGCRDFKETHKNDNTDDDDEDNKDARKDKSSDPRSSTLRSAGAAHVHQVCDSSGNVSGGREHTGENGKVAVDGLTSSMSTNTSINEPRANLTSPLPPQIVWSQSDKSPIQRNFSCKQQEMLDRTTFVTAGFLTLESMITEARNMLRHSYSLNDLDKSCDWDQPISSPRSVEVLNKTVRFAEEMERHHFSSTAGDELVEEPKLMAVNKSISPYIKAKVQDLVLYTGPEANNSMTDEQPTEELSSLDTLQKKLAAKESMHGVHGEMSEYLTTKPTMRQIFPRPLAAATPLQHQPSTSTLALSSHLALSTLPNATPITSTDPPPTPVHDRALSPVSEAMTPDECDSVISDWQSSPEDDGKCFLETLVDLLPAEVKALHQLSDTENKSNNSAAQPMPDIIEGQVKPVTSRHTTGAVEPIANVPPACFRVNTLPPEGHVFYFTYDADLHQTRFSTLIGRSVIDKRWAVLFGFQLVFNKLGLDLEAGSFPNIEANPYTSTEGGVYTLTHEELARVDAHHGYPEHYNRLIVPVWVCNSSDPDLYSIAQYCVPAVTYIAQQEWTTPVNLVPTESGEYSIRQVMKGAGQLSSGYRNHLSNLLQECCV